MSLTVVVLQSNYLPWKGYFDLINDSDVFVFYDDVQFTKNDWRNRNRIKTAAGAGWLSVPVGGNIRRQICEVELKDRGWQVRHWEALMRHYAEAPYFSRYEEFFRDVYLTRQWTMLSELNHYLIRSICGFLGIETMFEDSRKYRLEGTGSDRLLGLLKKMGAAHYVTGPSAVRYLDEPAFAEAGIEVIYKSYEGYPEYPQFFPPFEHAVSIVDTLFQLGPDAGKHIWGWRDARL
jgi:hypothetical protein